jgi:hypothetical protein
VYVATELAATERDAQVTAAQSVDPLLIPGWKDLLLEQMGPNVSEVTIRR